jgi:four helix bundle protein
MLNSQPKKSVPWDHKTHVEVLDIWKNAVNYFNEICEITHYIPEDVHMGIDSKIKSSALSIANRIAKGFHSQSKGEFQDKLEDAVDSVYATVSTMYLANKWNYLREDVFNQFYQDGELLVKKLQRFSQSIYKTEELN